MHILLAKSDFAVCNDGLEDFDIIETESISEDISNCMPVKELPSYVEHNSKNKKIRKEFMVFFDDFSLKFLC